VIRDVLVAVKAVMCVWRVCGDGGDVVLLGRKFRKVESAFVDTVRWWTKTSQSNQTRDLFSPPELSR
jgi:hypothetical protein